MTQREQALQAARAASEMRLAQIETETLAYIAEEAKNISEQGKDHQYIDEEGVERMTRSGRWLMDLK